MRERGEQWVLRDYLRDALSNRLPRTAPVLFSMVAREYGDVDQRRMWRYLSWLMQRGIAVRLAPRHYNRAEFIGEFDVGYVRGTGIEYPCDTADREWQMRAADHTCPVCLERRESVLPKWYRSTLCMVCYRTNQNETRFWKRLARRAA